MCGVVVGTTLRMVFGLMPSARMDCRKVVDRLHIPYWSCSDVCDRPLLA